MRLLFSRDHEARTGPVRVNDREVIEGANDRGLHERFDAVFIADLGDVGRDPVAAEIVLRVVSRALDDFDESARHTGGHR